jgi:hypothetical protein
MPQLMATAPPTAQPPAETSATDESLPDPSVNARNALAGLLGVAILVAVVMHGMGVSNDAWSPPEGDFNFALFAAFYAGAQIIERLMEYVAPFLPAWPAADSEGAVKAAYVKADRAKLTLGVAAVLGVAGSAAFGLYFLQTIGIDVSNTIDSIVTGTLIAAGTKPLHDFIDLLQDRNNPRTATTVQ